VSAKIASGFESSSLYSLGFCRSVSLYCACEIVGSATKSAVEKIIATRRMRTTLRDWPRSCQHVANRSCAGAFAGAILGVVTTSAMRSVRACLRIPAAAAPVFLFALASITRGAPPPQGTIAVVGTDSNLHYCHAQRP